MAQTNIKTAMRRTHEGAPARRDDPITHLEQVLNAHMLWEDTFYIDGVKSAAILTDAVVHAANADPLKTGLAIIDARHKHNIRHASLKAAVDYAKVGGPDARDLIRNVISRADELGEVLAMAGGRKAPHAVMKGVRDSFGRFDEYQFGKYRGEGKAITLRDAVFLTHPDPTAVPLVQKIVDGTLATPNTWETRLSAGAETKKEVFTDLLVTGKLGAMALLRNLRGMSEAGVSPALICEVMEAANWSKVLPFRFLSAVQAAPMFADALDKAFIKAVGGSVYLRGKTAVMVDTSGSMSWPISARSSVQRHHAGAAIAAAINGDRVDLFEWATTTRQVPNFRSLSTALSMRTGTVGHGTAFAQAWHKVTPGNYDRYIVLSDMQFGDGGYIRMPEGGDWTGYTINLGSYKQQGIIPGRWAHLSGFSAQVLNWIAANEG